MTSIPQGAVETAIPGWNRSGINEYTGEIRTKYDSAAVRVGRFMRQAAVRKLLPKSSTAKCLRARIKGANNVPIYKSKDHDAAHYGNLQTCSSVWQCPVCAARISERRREELKHAIAQADQAGSVSLVTLTFSHKRTDQLARLKTCITKAYSSMTEQRAYKTLLSDFEIYGTVRAFEVTWSEANGWHPHFHVLWFSERTLTAEDHVTIRDRLYKFWRAAATKHNLGAPSEERGVDVRGGEHAAKYGAKWGLEQEMTKGHMKAGKGNSCTPFDLLGIYADEDCKRAGALFAEFARVFKGARQLRWSKGLKERFEITTLSDQDINTAQEDEAILLARLSLKDWKLVCRAEARGALLEIARNGGEPAIRFHLDELRRKHPMPEGHDSQHSRPPT